MKQLLRTLSLLALSGVLLTGCGSDKEDNPTPAITEHTVRLVAEADQPFTTPSTTPSLESVAYTLPGSATVAVPITGSLKWEKSFTNVKDISILSLTSQSMSATRLNLYIYVDGDLKGAKVNSATTPGQDQQSRTAVLQWSEKLGVL